MRSILRVPGLPRTSTLAIISVRSGYFLKDFELLERNQTCRNLPEVHSRCLVLRDRDASRRARQFPRYICPVRKEVDRERIRLTR